MQAFKDTYGADRVSKVMTYSTEGSRSAILTVARGLGIDNDVASYIASLVIADRGTQRSLTTMYYGDDDNKPVPEFVKAMDEYPELFEGARKIEGICSGAGSHAGGVIFVDEPFTNTTALMRTNSGDIVTQFDLHNAEDASLIKIDLLSIEGLDKIRACLDLLLKDGLVKWQGSLKKTYESVIGIKNIERKAPEMWKLLHEHRVLSLFQMEKDSGVQALSLVKPTDVDQLASLNSVIRLMAQEEGAEVPLKKYARFRHDPSEWYKEMDEAGLTKDEQEVIKRILGASSGVCIYQEQVMMLVMEPQIGGFSLNWSDKLRRSIAKKKPKDFLQLEQEFFDNMREKKLSEKLCKYVWYTLVYTQRGYGFNCCSGSTVLVRGSSNDKWTPTIADMYRIMNDCQHAKESGHKDLYKKYRHYGYGTALSMYEDGRLHCNTIVDIVPSGLQETYEIKTVSGSSCICTVNHRFPTPTGLKRLDELTEGEYLYCVNPEDCTDGTTPFLSSIVSITPQGVEMTYDVEMADPAHTFVTDSGLITHNSAHCLSYSLIALQELNLCYKYPIIYWDCANLLVDSGSLEAASKGTNYGKMAVAIANIRKNDIKVELPLINEAQRGFIPNVEEDEIIFSLKAINGVGDDVVSAIISNRPYASFDDFCDKLFTTKLVTTAPMVALIKAGCFNKLCGQDRVEVMDYFLKRYLFTPNTSLTKSNLAKIREYDLVPAEYRIMIRMLDFGSYILGDKFLYSTVVDEKKKVPKCGYHDRIFKLNDVSMPFFTENFSEDSVAGTADGYYLISEKTFGKELTNSTQPLVDWLKSPETLELYNITKYQKEYWEQYASGSPSAWDMATLSFYYGEHELKDLQEEPYGVVSYFDLPKQPHVYDYSYRWKAGQRIEVPKFKIVRLAGTVINADNPHHTITLLTVYGAVNVKFGKGQYAFYNRQISKQLDENSSKKTVVDKPWFKRGTLLMVCGYRQDDNFRAYRYNDTVYLHTATKISKVNEDGTVELITERESAD